MKWFQHDSDASSDAKIRKLILRHGTDGYAIYFHCIELIAGAINDKNITFELEHDAEIIADNLKVKGDNDFSAIDKVNRIMKDIIDLELFDMLDNSKIICYKLALRLDNTVSRNMEMKKLQTAIKSKLKLPDNTTTNEQRSNNVDETEDVKTPDVSEHTTSHYTTSHNNKKKKKRDKKDQNELTERITRYFTYWNKKDNLIEHRYTVANLSGAKLNDINVVMEKYSNEEIRTAVHNYSWLKESPQHEIGFEYGDCLSFLTKGIPAFSDTELCKERFAIKKSFKEQEAEREDAEREKFKEHIKSKDAEWLKLHGEEGNEK